MLPVIAEHELYAQGSRFNTIYLLLVLLRTLLREVGNFFTVRPKHGDTTVVFGAIALLPAQAPIAEKI